MQARLCAHITPKQIPKFQGADAVVFNSPFTPFTPNKCTSSQKRTLNTILYSSGNISTAIPCVLLQINNCPSCLLSTLSEINSGIIPFRPFPWCCPGLQGIAPLLAFAGSAGYIASGTWFRHDLLSLPSFHHKAPNLHRGRP